VEQHNQTVVRDINRHNQAVADHNRQVLRNRETAIREVNRQIDRYNAHVRAEHQRITSALSRVRYQSIPTQFTVLRSSAVTLNEYFDSLSAEDFSHIDQNHHGLVSELPARENANSLEVVAGLQLPVSEHESPIQLNTTITNELRTISVDLHERWHGAIFALNPRNPDAARHFCTSAREILAGILELRIPDTSVLAVHPNCDKTRDGKPTRRSKIRFALHQKGILSDAMEGFINQDLDNVVELFSVFNQATHGAAGRFAMHQLVSIKKRVEDGILFLTRIAG
jgi:predicted pPIWI-associating nuclease